MKKPLQEKSLVNLLVKNNPLNLDLPKPIWVKKVKISKLDQQKTLEWWKEIIYTGYNYIFLIKLFLKKYLKKR